MAISKIFFEKNKNVVSAINNCLKAIEEAGLTSQEAQRIPEYLECAIKHENSRQLKATGFCAPELVFCEGENGFTLPNRWAK